MRYWLLVLLGLTMILSSCGDGSSSALIQPVAEEILPPDDKGLSYKVGLFKDENFNPQKITHLIVVGSAMHEDSDQFFQSGISRAFRYKDVWPDHQVVIISTPDVISKTDDQVFSKYKINIVKTVRQRFTAPMLIREMNEFSKIASFDFFGHSSPWALKLDDVSAPFDPSSLFYELSALRKNFLPNAYATLNACNTGFAIAPYLSRALEIPVSGSLTSSVFETIESDGLWYKEDDKNKNQYVTTNRASFKDKISCSSGACSRMKASRHNYSSIWGTFKDGGLSFDKFFCNFKDARDGKCEKGMAMSLFGFPSVKHITPFSRVSDFKKVVYDWLCSTGKNGDYLESCIYGIESAVNQQDLIFRSHPTNELECDFFSCNAKIECDMNSVNNMPVYGTCRVITTPNPRPTNVAKEYLSLMRGFDQIRE
jgi:hypothetical protein